ncbi:DUF1559 domain-containing protein [Anatilimnocola sp. NA78]|uniref:DUF1559 family PulG-like putative transporter n=1 Tax=Anatilimnocola sp. NA78 TaxID=3415683 RepID=UPI003CE49407
MRSSLRRAPAGRAFTLVELLVVIAIIGVLVALLLPAVQAAREAARRTQCINHLKQIGLAMHNYNDTFGYFPNSRRDASYTWMVTILPYVEQAPLYAKWNVSTGSYYTQTAECKEAKVSVYFCPSRRTAGTAKFSRDAQDNTTSPTYNSSPADYAICVGDSSVNTGDYWQDNGVAKPANGIGILWNGKMSTTPPVLPNGPAFKQVGLREIIDGTSNTLMVGDKHLYTKGLNDPSYADGGCYNGDQGHSLRSVGTTRPLTKGAQDPTKNASFGSWHSAVTNFVLVDGSVRSFENSANTTMLGYMAGKDDGQVSGL